MLSVGEQVQEVAESESGFLGSVQTLCVQLLGNSSILQVHAGGVRKISKERRIDEWKAPASKRILMAVANAYQCIISLSSGELVYFRLNQATGSLEEIDKRDVVNREIVGVREPKVVKGLRQRINEQKAIEEAANDEDAYAGGFVTNREADFGENFARNRHDAEVADAEGLEFELHRVRVFGDGADCCRRCQRIKLFRSRKGALRSAAYVTGKVRLNFISRTKR